MDILCSLHDKPVKVEYTGGTPGDIHGIRADVSSAKERLNWEPTVNLEDGVKEMLCWAQYFFSSENEKP